MGCNIENYINTFIYYSNSFFIILSYFSSTPLKGHGHTFRQHLLKGVRAPAWWSSTGWVQCCVSSSCRTWAYCPSSAGSSCRLCSPRNSSCITLFYSYLFYYIIIQLFSILFIFFFLFFGFNNVACSNFQQRRREL